MLKEILIVALLSMTPVLELRAALPAGIAMGMDAWVCYGLCVAFNMVPVPFIILLLRYVLQWLHGFGGKADKLATWVEEHAQKKTQVYKKYQILGLFLLVAIPIPGTGAWTGALVASFMGMRLKDSVPPILFGVAAAGLVMLLVSMGVIHIMN